MLKYQDGVKPLLSVFFAYRNDIDIYTEDEDKDREFYRILFSRLIDPKIRINDITPLGCSKNVINRCKEEKKSSRKKIFIIDGDFELINDNIEEIENLFVLDKYCIENYLIDEYSALKFIHSNCGVKSIEQIKKEFEYESWLEIYSKCFVELFIHLAIMRSLGKAFKLFNAYRYHVKKEHVKVFNKELIKNDINSLKDVIIQEIGSDNYELKCKKLNTVWDTTVNSLLTIVSGKDYLIPILLIKTQDFKASKSLPTLEEIKINLVENFDLSKLAKLKEAIET